MSSCQSGKNPRDDTVWALLPPPLSLKKILATHLAYVQSKYTNRNIIIIKAKIKASAWKTIRKTQYDNYEG